MPESIILDHRGKRIRKSELSGEIAAPSMTGVRQVWDAQSVASTITPDIMADVLRGVMDGDAHAYLTLAEEMEERDLHYAAVLGTRKRAVNKLPLTVESASDSARDIELADAIRAQLRRPDLRHMKADLLDGLGKGYSVVEMDWDTSGRPWVPSFKWRDPRFFMYDRNDGATLRLRDEADPINGLALKPYRFIIHEPHTKSGLQIRSGLARLVAVAYMCKSYTLTDWMTFAELFGMPIRLGRYGSSATENDIMTLISALANLGTDAAAAIPKNMDIEFVDGNNGSGGHELFERLADWLDRQVSKAVLGQTMTTDNGSSMSQAKVHDEVREDIQEDDSADLADTLNRDFVRPFIDLNYGAQKEYPRIEINVPKPEDVKALAEALERLVPLGLRVEESVIRDKLGVPDPAEGAVLLQPIGQQPATATAANHSSTCQCGGVSRALNRSSADPLDLLDEQADAAAEDWEPVMRPVIDPVQALADESESYEDFLGKLPMLIDEMGADELVKRLALETFKARVDGAQS